MSYILAVAGALVGAVLLVLSQFNPPAFAALRSAATEVTAPASTEQCGPIHESAAMVAVGLTQAVG